MAIAVALPASARAGKSPHHSIVQTQFSAEDEGVKSPVTIPPEVMAILGEDDMVKEQMKNEKSRPAELPQSWFSASKIRLAPTTADGLIVQATGPLVGGNVVVFWVFIQSQNGWRLALMIPAHNLIVTQTRFNRYRNLEADAMTCCTITTARFRFDGREYRRYFSKTEDIK
jgi:hypothetical protein